MAQVLPGSTVQRVVKRFNLPYSTCERIVKKQLNEEILNCQESLIKEASECGNLILGIDNFAIRKRHTYNTGIHNLNHETLLTIVKSTTYTNLIENNELIGLLARLNLKTFVMDLARNYHKFCAKVFSNTLRVADCFHVNQNIIATIGKRYKHLLTQR